MKFHIKKGDKVKVIAGDHKNEEGRVLEVDRLKYRALVEGVNLVSRHTKPNATNPDGGIIKKEAPILLSCFWPNEPEHSRSSVRFDADWSNWQSTSSHR